MRVAVIVVVAAGCGRLDFTTSRSTADGTVPNADASGDGVLGGGDAPGADAPAACSTWSAFSAPQALPAVLQSSDDDWDPTPSADELELVFYSYRGASADLYDARRTSKAAAWSTPVALGTVNTANAEGDPTLTGDGLDLFYDEQVGGALKLHTAHRTAVDQPFGAPALLAGVVNGSGDAAQPFISLDGLRLYYRAATAIAEATRTDRGAVFGPFTQLVSDTGGDNDPTVSADGLELIFSSKARGGAGGADLFTARRPALDQPFGAVTRIAELASTRDEVGPRLSADGATLYFNYNTDTSGTQGLNADMYLATRTCQ